MSREILFRGKVRIYTPYSEISIDEWAEGYYYRREGDSIIYDPDKEIEYVVNPSTVGQYTGLKDRMKTKIFEGDEVAWSWGETFNGVWEQNGVVIVNLFDPEDMRCLYEAHELLVIGNIHDTPELAKEESE